MSLWRRPSTASKGTRGQEGTPRGEALRGGTRLVGDVGEAQRPCHVSRLTSSSIIFCGREVPLCHRHSARPIGHLPMHLTQLTS